MCPSGQVERFKEVRGRRTPTTCPNGHVGGVWWRGNAVPEPAREWLDSPKMQPDTKTYPHMDVFLCLAGGRRFRKEVNWPNMKNALVGSVFHDWKVEWWMGKQ